MLGRLSYRFKKSDKAVRLRYELHTVLQILDRLAAVWSGRLTGRLARAMQQGGRCVLRSASNLEKETA